MYVLVSSTASTEPLHEITLKTLKTACIRTDGYLPRVKHRNLSKLCWAPPISLWLGALYYKNQAILSL